MLHFTFRYFSDGEDYVLLVVHEMRIRVLIKSLLSFVEGSETRKRKKSAHPPLAWLFSHRSGRYKMCTDSDIRIPVTVIILLFDAAEKRRLSFKLKCSVSETLKITRLHGNDSLQSDECIPRPSIGFRQNEALSNVHFDSQKASKNQFSYSANVFQWMHSDGFSFAFTAPIFSFV